MALLAILMSYSSNLGVCLPQQAAYGTGFHHAKLHPLLRHYYLWLLLNIYHNKQFQTPPFFLHLIFLQ